MATTDPRCRTEAALRRRAERISKLDSKELESIKVANNPEALCRTCSHPARLHAPVGEWCARCAAVCAFVAVLR